VEDQNAGSEGACHAWEDGRPSRGSGDRPLLERWIT
jgi:hypothetical protein